MRLLFLSKLLFFVCLIISISLFIYRWLSFLKFSNPREFSSPKSSVLNGIVYAFTIGMAPWAKESTRTHWILYLRGILFHTGIFTAFFALFLLVSFGPLDYKFSLLFAVFIGTGALMGIIGIFLRIFEENLRKISTLDDHISLFLVSGFLLAITFSLLSSSFMPFMLILTSLMVLYAPFSKIRHFIFFFFSRIFFGAHLGKRGIIQGLEVKHGK